MPNTPALVNQGCSVFVRGTQATQKDVDITQKLFEAIGTCEEIIESLMDPVTALSGSGPAYVFVMIEALADGGVKMGKSLYKFKLTNWFTCIEPVVIYRFTKRFSLSFSCTNGSGSRPISERFRYSSWQIKG